MEPELAAALARIEALEKALIVLAKEHVTVTEVIERMQGQMMRIVNLIDKRT